MVAASETNLQELLEGARQYRVPLYQRTYAWTAVQLERLWEDLVQIAEDRAADHRASHFIGSLVLAPSPSNGPTGVPEFLVVDGQQRLTTLTVLLAAIRDHRVATESPENRERINELYLINKFKPEAQRIKLVPTQADRPQYNGVIDGAPIMGASAVLDAYRFFRSRLVAADDPEDPHDIERLEDAVLRGLALVSVTAQAGDNAHRIFESLNNTGLRLTQGDLLRNYLFMRLPTRGEQVYESTWLPLQKSLTSDELELLFWLDLAQQDPAHRQADTYAAQQQRLNKLHDERDIEAEVVRFRRLGGLLRVILDPTLEEHPGVRLRLERLKAWGTTTVYPLLLRLLDLRDRGEATSDQVAAAALYVESYLVRRLIVGRATQGLNRILLATVHEMPQDLPVEEAVRVYLSTGRKHYGSDADVAAAVATAPFYLTGRPNQRNLILRWLEESYESKEPVALGGLTIEHVLPQTLTDSWIAELGLAADEDPEQMHAEVVHTLANLTLTGYNSVLSNSPFHVKREQLATSGLRMNQEIAKEDHWGVSQLKARAARLAARITETWPGPVAGALPAGGPNWPLLATALAALPSGSWTSYGDLAALIGSHAVPVGQYIAGNPVPNAHRVLKAAGVVSPDFRWLEPGRTDSPEQMLRDEGVEFDDAGRASKAQRFTSSELAALVGLEPETPPAELSVPASDSQTDLRDTFIAQLGQAQSPETVHGVLALLDGWTRLGGRLEFGEAGEVSCYLMATDATRLSDKVWPFTIYPSGKVEVVFQYMLYRAPFESWELRDEFRRRLNEVPGVDLPIAKVSMRPGFHVDVTIAKSARDSLLYTLEWFRGLAVRSQESPDENALTVAEVKPG
ncbi:GmrSD restriction endonuclease domain-containing protein [Geodermatophilus sp. CPCC 206100]|uniref:GmrSD restriction endonuclease domain-containing protein n=1 Tax=Geodermatophilus sp. CPCC 206100 TaxID=3020054 RepID=UPI003AFF71A6